MRLKFIIAFLFAIASAAIVLAGAGDAGGVGR